VLALLFGLRGVKKGLHMERTHCWCGESNLQEFSPDYWYCQTCGTLVLRNWPDEPLLDVHDTGELYSKEYYLSRLPEQYGYPDLLSRARYDLSDRVLHWLNTLVQFKLPPAAILELGCGHGGFVAVLQEAGYDATGLELSPWLVEWAKELFQIPVLQGPLEKQNLLPNSLDVVALMDVLEHLPDPEHTMRLAASLLKEDGFFLIQTPDFHEDYTFSSLLEKKHPFLQQFKTDQHLFLFSQRSVQELFKRIGFNWVQFEPAIFSDYDMFFIASRYSLSRNSSDDVTEALSQGRSQRFVQAMLDLRGKLLACDHDRIERGKQIVQLTNWVHEWEQRAHEWEQRARYYVHMVRLIRDSLFKQPVFKLVNKLGGWKWVVNTLEEIAALDEGDGNLQEQQ
jgi:2-polyprenyl-3-methyl-5-hydroxy-6-metoxy-1,4-benzoquinol methylase